MAQRPGSLLRASLQLCSSVSSSSTSGLRSQSRRHLSSRSTPSPLASSSQSRLISLAFPTPGARHVSSTSRPFPTSKRTSLFRPLNLLVVLMPIVTFGLGVWQVKRLRWKLDLIEEIQSNIEREPIVLPQNINISALPDFAFRRVLLKGHFTGPAMLLGPIVEHGVPGSHLILPFSRASSGGSTILLNRGFITSTRATAIREGREIPPGLREGEGEMIVEGMLTKRFTEGQGKWAPDNQPEDNLWFWKDVDGMVEWAGKDGQQVQPVIVDAIDYGEQPPTLLMQQGIPLGKPPTVEIRNQHATYAVTWFSLSAATAVMVVYILRRGSGANKLPKRLRPV